MWIYNKYTLGDIITHSNFIDLDFQVHDILKTEPDTKGRYLYHCVLVDGYPEKLGEQFKYHESSLSLIRKGTQKELEILLNTSIVNEEYELSQKLKNILDNF
ncbi:hypothetical protein H3Z83_01685 [Tenacibaculum sp. S7007]|uniref:Uncharacterized protein n=1 Tax=Tenacibaculum pelagium TaxID=2759527 RepID=A0A839ALG8_9FLAO|nr:hypothetical protein [Tenacibaculum pelagium]MBA6155238.1 hypothetical protein [Tenacibaculum pelagium]